MEFGAYVSNVKQGAVLCRVDKVEDRTKNGQWTFTSVRGWPVLADKGDEDEGSTSTPTASGMCRLETVGTRCPNFSQWLLKREGAEEKRTGARVEARIGLWQRGPLFLEPLTAREPKALFLSPGRG